MIDKNFPAFPFQYEDGAGGYIQHPGMTMRQAYKMAVITGMYSNQVFIQGETKTSIANYAGEQADALLAENAAREGEDG